MARGVTLDDFREKTVLVTGGAGFIAANLIRALLDLGAVVHVLVRPGSDLWRLAGVIPRINLHRCDLRDAARLTELMITHPPEVIFNTIKSGPYSDTTDSTGSIENNLLAAYTLVEASRMIGYSRLVHFGSSTEYGPKDRPMREDDVLEPQSAFGITKAAATMMLRQAAIDNGQPVVILRPFHVFGDWELPRRLIPAAIKAGLTGRPLPMTHPGIGRDYIYVRDVVNAALLAAGAPNVAGEIINICTGIQTDNYLVVETIGLILGKKIEMQSGTYAEPIPSPSLWVGDNSKAGRLLGWIPEYTLEAGLRKTVSFISQHKQYYGLDGRQ